MEILNFNKGDPSVDECEVWDYDGNRLFEGTRDECEDYIFENLETEN